MPSQMRLVKTSKMTMNRRRNSKTTTRRSLATGRAALTMAPAVDRELTGVVPTLIPSLLVPPNALQLTTKTTTTTTTMTMTKTKKMRVSVAVQPTQHSPDTREQNLNWDRRRWDRPSMLLFWPSWSDLSANHRHRSEPRASSCYWSPISRSRIPCHPHCHHRHRHRHRPPTTATATQLVLIGNDIQAAQVVQPSGTR